MKIFGLGLEVCQCPINFFLLCTPRLFCIDFIYFQKEGKLEIMQTVLRTSIRINAKRSYANNGEEGSGVWIGLESVLLKNWEHGSVKGNTVNSIYVSCTLWSKCIVLNWLCFSSCDAETLKWLTTFLQQLELCRVHFHVLIPPSCKVRQMTCSLL